MRVKAIVIGGGEIGLPLFEVIKNSYPDTMLYDIKNPGGLSAECEVLNICIPYRLNFIEEVERYQGITKPELTIIHSTVMAGTTAQIESAVHSPVLGDHTNMRDSLMQFQKWIGGALAEKAKGFLSKTGMVCRTVPTSNETELLKLMCLAKYGMSIAFAQYQDDICEKEGFPYEHILEWDRDYNAHVDPSKQRPILTPPGGKIGGHCITPGVVMLNEDYGSLILEEVLFYE